MSKPIVSVAGIRGIIGESLVPEEFLRYTLAYAATRRRITTPPTDSNASARAARSALPHVVTGRPCYGDESRLTTRPESM